MLPHVSYDHMMLSVWWISEVGSQSDLSLSVSLESVGWKITEFGFVVMIRFLSSSSSERNHTGSAMISKARITWFGGMHTMRIYIYIYIYNITNIEKYDRCEDFFQSYISKNETVTWRGYRVHISENTCLSVILPRRKTIMTDWVDKKRGIVVTITVPALRFSAESGCRDQWQLIHAPLTVPVVPTTSTIPLFTTSLMPVPTYRNTIYILCDLIRYYYVENRRVQVAKHLSPESKAITNFC